MVNIVKLQFYEPKEKRPSGLPTPCGDCPKCKGIGSKEQPSPTVGRRLDLSPKNQKTLDMYHQAQAMSGNVPVDDIMLKNFGLIHNLYQTYEQSSLAMAAAMPKVAI